jgi:NADH dehydrogenase
MPAAALSPRPGHAASSRHRVVIIGCGFGGLFAARALRRADVEVTVIDQTNHHLFQPLLYQVATGILSEGDIAPPIRDVLRKQKNTDVLLGEASGINTGARTIRVDTLSGPRDVPYDSLIVAAGAGQSYFGHEEFAEFAPGMKSIDDALELRGRIFGAFEAAELEFDPARRESWMTFVVVGGGPTGVEMAGQIAELSHRSLSKNYRSIDPRDARVVLVDAGKALVPNFGTRLSGKAQARLEKLGVEIHLNTAVTKIDNYAVETNSKDPKAAQISARTKMWAAGVAGAPIGKIVADATGAATDRSGRIEVQADLTIAGHPNIFIVGDLMNLDHLPGVAEVAMQSGRYAAEKIVHEVRGKKSDKPFKYHDLGNMATVSRFSAICAIGPLRIAGFLGWLLWLFVHLLFLTGFKNRVATVFNWAIAFVGRGRPQRAITNRQSQLHTPLARETR